jgi:peptide/nickel transport system substrate-binding protein
MRQGAPPRPTPTPTPPPPATSRHGESLRITGYITHDVFDPHKTLDGAFYGHQSLIFSRLLAYESHADNSMFADLARAMPEQPDPQTLVFRLEPNARWHEVAPLGGRAVTAEDVRVSIERQREGDPSFVRKARWQLVDRIETPEPGTITFHLAEPHANALGLFADVNAFIVPVELAGAHWDRNTQLGSGPFRWVEWNEGAYASVSRNSHWHGGGDRPYLDGLTVVQPKDTAEVEAGLRTKKLDAVFVGRPQAARLKRAVPALQESTIGHSRFYGMRFFEPQFPYNDVRFRTAVSIALDRREMVERFFEGSGAPNPWVSWPMTRWTLPRTELVQLPGYRAGSGGREADIAEAKALLAAFASNQTVPADLALFVPDDAEAFLGIGRLMREQLARTLGLNVSIYPMAIGDLAPRMLTGEAPWGAAPDDGWVDLDDWLYPYFHSAGTKNSFGLRNAELDALILAQRHELDETRRREIGYEVQRRLLQINVGVNFVSEEVVSLRWPYVRNFPLDTSDGYQHRFADAWIDRSDPSFRGR